VLGGGVDRGTTVVKEVTVKPFPTSTGFPVTQVGVAEALNEPGKDVIGVERMAV
jgi:hypothetical protein